MTIFSGKVIRKLARSKVRPPEIFWYKVLQYFCSFNTWVRGVAEMALWPSKCWRKRCFRLCATWWGVTTYQASIAQTWDNIKFSFNINIKIFWNLVFKININIKILQKVYSISKSISISKFFHTQYQNQYQNFSKSKINIKIVKILILILKIKIFWDKIFAV